MDAKIIAVYQKLIATKFPEVYVCLDPRLGRRNSGTLGVFGIADERIEEYLDFMLDCFDELREARELPDVPTLPRTASVTKEYYPEIWEKMCRLKKEKIERRLLSVWLKKCTFVPLDTSLPVMSKSMPNKAPFLVCDTKERKEYATDRPINHPQTTMAA